MNRAEVVRGAPNHEKNGNLYARLVPGSWQYAGKISHDEKQRPRVVGKPHGTLGGQMNLSCSIWDDVGFLSHQQRGVYREAMYPARFSLPVSHCFGVHRVRYLDELSQCQMALVYGESLGNGLLICAEEATRRASGAKKFIRPANQLPPCTKLRS